LNEFIQHIINNTLLAKIGDEVIAIIQQRTLRGEYLPGSTEKGYSTKPTPMPYGGLIARLGEGRAKQVFRAIQKGEETAIWRESKTKKIWLVLKGGYKRLRELAGKESERVTMNWRGNMMRTLKYKSDPTQGIVTIYFTNKEAAEIAGFHHEGTGRTKIVRRFMGLTKKEQQKIGNWLGTEIAKRCIINFRQPIRSY
jgi:hypothetical protein